MVFHYIPSSGDAVASTNPALGTVMFQTSYRSTDATPTSKVEMLNEYWASENVPAQAFCHPIECDPKENPFNVQYVRTGTLPSTENQLMYDLGKTFVATQGMQTTGNPVGDVWVTYEIELKKPLLASNVSNAIDTYEAYNSTATTTSVFANLTSSDTSTLAVTFPTAMQLTMPRGCVGTYLLLVSFYPSASFSAFSSTAGAGFSFIACTQIAVPISNYIGNNQTGGTNSWCAVIGTKFRIDDPGVQASISLPALSWTIGSGTVGATVFITQLS
jgi:hypothetical protein